MHKIIKYIFLILFVFSGNTSYAYVAHPQERITFWRNNFTTLSTEDPHAKKAHTIFKKLVSIAGNRNGINPMLHIVANAPKNIPLPMAIPDGWIIISKNTLDFAYESPSRGDDILAFILAHEIAHQMEDDFWHMKFFQAINNSKKKSNNEQLTEIQRLVSQSDKMVAKELRADEQGLTFTAMAGFNTQAILDNKNKGDFFKRWINRFSKNNFSIEKKSTTHPSPKQRELAIHSRLNQIHQQSQLFKLGLWLYQAGHYSEAKDAFVEFRHYFPGRAVNHNIALSYHQLALQAMPADEHLDFRTTLSLDPYTYASQANRNIKLKKEKSAKLLDLAIGFYELSISQDRQYISAYNNLASAYLQKNEVYKAIGLLQDAIKIKPENIKLLNNLAVAFYKVENKDKARSLFLKAISLDNKYIDVLYNLGLYYQANNNETKASNYWNQFLKVEPYSGWSKKIYKQLNKTYTPLNSHHNKAENLSGIQIGHYLDEIPPNWKLQESHSLKLNNHNYNLSSYQNGILSITEEGEITYIIAKPNYQGKTNNSVKINDPTSVLILKYGDPGEIQNSTTGTNMIYRDSGISFQIINNKIKSWLLFRS